MTAGLETVRNSADDLLFPSLSTILLHSFTYSTTLILSLLFLSLPSTDPQRPEGHRRPMRGDQLLRLVLPEQAEVL